MLVALRNPIASTAKDNLLYDALAQSASGVVDANAKVRQIKSIKIPSASDLIPDATSNTSDFKTTFINLRHIELSVCYICARGSQLHS